jgi:hypothetical protein
LEGGFVSDELLEGFMREAIIMQSAHRRFLMQIVGGAMNVWDRFHAADAMKPEDAAFIMENILGGKEASLFDLLSDAELAKAGLEEVPGAEEEIRNRKGILD